nr:unnamed protein product [Callosobruchus analis]
MSSTLPALERFDLKGENASVGLKWERWKRALSIYLKAADIKAPLKQRATLLHFGG